MDDVLPSSACSLSSPTSLNKKYPVILLFSFFYFAFLLHVSCFVRFLISFYIVAQFVSL